MSAEEQKNMDIVEMDDKKKSFINEQIAPKKKTKMKKFLISLGTTSIVAVVFGVISSFVFSVSGIYFKEVFGENDTNKNVIFLTEAQQEELKEPTAVVAPAVKEPTEATDAKEMETTEPSVEGIQSENDNIILKEQIAANLDDLQTIYGQLQEKAEETNKSIVKVSGIQSGVDWFDNPVESTDASYGLLIANNGRQLLFLTGKSSLEDASSLQVTFTDGVTVDAQLYADDTILDIAVVAVDVELLSEQTLSTVKVATLGETSYATPGTLVMALGNPNGSMYSMEFGMVTSQPVRRYITDSDLDLFDTDMTYNDNGSGIIVDLSGNVLGVISSRYEIDYSQNMSVVGISKMKPIIENLINSRKTGYAGVVVNDITAEYRNEMGIASGIYVTEVLANSPALSAGLRSGDIILSVGSNAVESVEHFHELLLHYEANAKVELEVYHTAMTENQKETIALQLLER